MHRKGELQWRCDGGTEMDAQGRLYSNPMTNTATQPLKMNTFDENRQIFIKDNNHNITVREIN